MRYKSLLIVLITLFTTTSLLAQEKVTVLLDWFINPNHAPILVAEQIGAFKAEGVEVELIPPADPAMPPRLVAAKKADIAISYQPQLHMAVDQGLPLIRIGTLIDKPLNTLIVLSSSGIKTIADLKGKKIGYSASGSEEATLEGMLNQAGISLKEIKLVNVNFQLVSALMSGRVDAVLGGMRNFEAIEIRQLGAEPKLFNIEEYGVPPYDELILLVNKESINQAKIRKFLIALKKGTAYLQSHPKETWQLFSKRYPELNNKLNKTAWMETIPLFAHNPMLLSSERYQAYSHFLFKGKLIHKETPVNEYAIELKQ